MRLKGPGKLTGGGQEYLDCGPAKYIAKDGCRIWLYILRRLPSEFNAPARLAPPTSLRKYPRSG